MFKKGDLVKFNVDDALAIIVEVDHLRTDDVYVRPLWLVPRRVMPRSGFYRASAFSLVASPDNPLT